MSADKTEPGDSWSPEDLDAIMAGGRTYVLPTMLRRSDGRTLLYPGKLHSLAGEPEAGKTWVALLAIAEVINAGQVAWLIDFEDCAESAVERLLDLGVAPEVISAGLRYISPSERFDNNARSVLDRLVYEAVPALVVIDASTEAMNTLGLDPMSTPS
jgi:hypothetical protein